MLRRFAGVSSPMVWSYEKAVQLSQKSLLGMGHARCDPQESQHTICEFSIHTLVHTVLFLCYLINKLTD